MANAYATLASGGMRNKPIAILRVKFPDGEVEELGKPKRERVLTDAQAYEVTKILKQNVTAGTGRAANIGCPSAGKTGTTDNFNDAWYDGYTPYLATAVWVGYPDALREMRSVHGISVAGGTFPAQIWKKFMDVAKGERCSDFAQPKTRISWSPFFGRYSKGGTGYGTNDGIGPGYGDDTSGGGYQGYDPRLYDEPGGGSPDEQSGGSPGGGAPGDGNSGQDGGTGLGGE
jgi:penicillin-binding protein 1A